MRVGVLDVGSNSAQLQIVDVTDGGPPLPAHALKQPTLLSNETLDDGSISEIGIERVAAAVTASVKEARLLGLDRFYPFVTAVIRDAPNREQVLDSVEELAGLRPQFLSGEQEARLTYAAVRRWFGWSSGRILLLNIGGGTLEIVLGRDAEPDLAISLPLGVRPMTRAFLVSDPTPSVELKRLRRHVRNTLGEVADRIRWEGPARMAVATSKTFKQLARLAGAAPQRKGPFVARTLDRADVHAWIPRLAEMPVKERGRLRGVSRTRANHILAGAVIADLTMNALDVRSVQLSPWALREGIALCHLDEMSRTPAVPLTAVIGGHESDQEGTAVTALPSRV
jgi:exopolyphosphatase/guanosine-5'-triphosphate,3'-diphosphate pyrophosphatase